jgi:hypothetical protein
MCAPASSSKPDRVLRTDVLRPHHPGDFEIAHLEIGPRVVMADNDEVAGGLDLRHHRGDALVDLLVALDLGDCRVVGDALGVGQLVAGCAWKASFGRQFLPFRQLGPSRRETFSTSF